MISPLYVLSLGAAKLTVSSINDPTSPTISFFICYSPQSVLYFWAGKLLALGQHLFKACVEPSANSKWHLEGFYIENDLQCFPRSVKHNATLAAPRNVVLESPPEFGGTFFVDIVRE